MKETSNPCGPRGKERSSLSSADQVPSTLNVTWETVNVLDSPSIENVNVGFNGFQETSDSPDPLLDVSDPVTLKNSPGSGFAVI